MKQQLKILLFAFMCLAIPTSHAGQNEQTPLWGSTFYGMTLKEVLTSVPNAQSTPNNIKPSLLNPNEQALAKLDNIEITNEAFSAWFIFSNGKLSRVTLTLISRVSDTGVSVPSDYLNALYAHYSLLLSVKYGNPIKKTWQDYAPTNVHLWNTQWAYGLTTIDLNVEKSELEINYGAPYADDLRKL